MSEDLPPRGEYVFRYPLHPGPVPSGTHPNRLTEMLREQLQNLLDLLVPVSGTRDQRVNAFRLLNDPEHVHPLYRQGPANGRLQQAGGTGPQASSGFRDAGNAALYEPRIPFIKAQLESLLSVVQLEEDGQPVDVDGFRLRNLRDWLVPSSGDPVEMFGYAGTRCDADCVFCYNRGNPPGLALNVVPRSADTEYEEMLARLQYFSPCARVGLFPSLGSTYEVFAHPRIFTVLRQLRRKTRAVFRITTHGGRLTADRIRRLATLKPVYLYLSLISSSPGRRLKLVRDRRPQVAIDALPLLRKAGIPYATIIVPWPVDSMDEMLGDLSSTAAYADQHRSHIIQINLPGYTRHFSPQPLYDHEQVWSAVVRRVRALRETISTPIVVIPGTYEENLCEMHGNRPTVIGLVQDSPAARAGVERGDELITIAGLEVQNRPQARQLLAAIQESGTEPVSLTVDRAGQQLSLTLHLPDFAYPYTGIVDRHLGIVMIGGGFRTGYLERLREIVKRHRAARVLFLSSELMRPTFERALSASPLFASGRPQIRLEVPPNRFFGGDICMGDLLVVQDFIDCIREYLATGNPRPDLVVIPSSPFNLGAWKRDLTGRVYLDIEREVGIPVELLECDTIYE